MRRRWQRSNRRPCAGALPDDPEEDDGRDRHHDGGIAEFGYCNHYRVARCRAKILQRTKNRAVGEHQRVAADDILKDTEEQPGCADEQDDQQCESPRFGA